MKNRFVNVLLIVALAVSVSGGLAACVADNHSADETSSEVGISADAEVEAETDAVASSEYIYEHMGYTVRLPGEYRDKVTLLSADEMDDNTIIAVYQTATLEIHPEAGFLFSIVRHTPAEFEDYWTRVDEIGGYSHFAKDESYYYSFEIPTDVQFDIAVMEEYQSLDGYRNGIVSWFIENNNLTEYDHVATVYEPDYTYPGVHAIYWVTLSNDEKIGVVLSKPIRQDEGGIWCVERMYDGEYAYEHGYESGHIIIAMPETDFTAMEYYEQLQAEANAGQRPELLDAEEVALAYLEYPWDLARHIVESRIEYFNE